MRTGDHLALNDHLFKWSILVQSPSPETEVLLSIHADTIGRHGMLVPIYVYGKERLENNADASSFVYEKKEADTFGTYIMSARLRIWRRTTHK